MHTTIKGLSTFEGQNAQKEIRTPKEKESLGVLSPRFSAMIFVTFSLFLTLIYEAQIIQMKGGSIWRNLNIFVTSIKTSYIDIF